MEGSEEQGAE
jgi:hypothetical protein